MNANGHFISRLSSVIIMTIFWVRFVHMNLRTSFIDLQIDLKKHPKMIYYNTSYPFNMIYTVVGLIVLLFVLLYYLLLLAPSVVK